MSTNVEFSLRIALGKNVYEVLRQFHLYDIPTYISSHRKCDRHILNINKNNYK